MRGFAVGYRQAAPGEPPFAQRIARWADQVAEVYFAWPGQPSGRPPTSVTDPAGFIADLRLLRELGIALNLLFNAACDGPAAASLALAEHIATTLGDCQTAVGLPDVVTTASPAVAHVLRTAAAAPRVRASVNLRLGTIGALPQVADLFDGYYLQRDLQRDVHHLDTLARWAHDHGKDVGILVNSGCLRHCATQGWHDNLVAHVHEAADRLPLPDFVPLTCRRHLAEAANRQAILQATWVRPEDLDNYTDLVDIVKLATRSHPRPFQVLRAYCERHHRGDLLDLLEPGLGHALGAALDNQAFPDGWFAHTQACPADGACPYCARVLARALIPAGATGADRRDAGARA